MKDVVLHHGSGEGGFPGWAVVICFLAGMYAPTSIAGVYSKTLWLELFALLAALFALLLLRKRGSARFGLFANSVALVMSILVATMVSPYYDYRWGGLLGYLLLAALFVLYLRELSGASCLRGVFIAANIFNLTAGLAIIAGTDSARNFFVSHYTMFFPELVEDMTGLGKPVLTFGTHSVAAFFFYLFFWLNHESFKALRSTKYLLFATGYIVLGFCLLSVSGLLLMSLATAQLLFYFFHQRPRLAGALMTALCACTVFLYGSLREQVQDLQDAGSLASEIVMSPTNGFLGRFSDLGTVYSTVNYIRAHPFRPVGVGYRSDLFFGDSGPVEYYLRGSAPLVVAVYGGLYLFLRNNLLARRDALHLLLVIVLFEVGFSVLTYIRFLYILPAIVVYLNDLRRSQALATSAVHSIPC